MRVYLVGGAVRDALLQRPVTDRDYVVLQADDAALRQKMPWLKRVGGEPGVYIDRDAQYTVSRAQNIEQDLDSRDLTINALARELKPRAPLVAHPLALRDLEQRLLRPVNVANFGADPCRAVRAARFAAVLPGFVPTPELFTAMRHALAQGLGCVAAERIAQELRKACAGPMPGRFLALLGRAGCLCPWFAPFAGKPELCRETQALMQAMAGKPPCWVFMAMCRRLSVRETSEMASRLRLPGLWRRNAVDAVELLPTLREYAALPPVEKLALLMRCRRKGLLEALCCLAGKSFRIDMEPLRLRMERDLQRVLAARLPGPERDRGPASGKALLELRLRILREESGL